MPTVRRHRRLAEFKLAIREECCQLPIPTDFQAVGALSGALPAPLGRQRALIRSVDISRSRQAIVKGVMAMCEDLDITVIAEGVESSDELSALWDTGIRLFQGWYFAAAAVEAAADIPVERLRYRSA